MLFFYIFFFSIMVYLQNWNLYNTKYKNKLNWFRKSVIGWDIVENNTNPILLNNWNLLKLNYRQALSLGMHVGHTLKASRFYTSWMYIGVKEKVAIINPVYSAFSLKAMVLSLAVGAATRKPVWFINSRSAYFNIIKETALKCGESYIITRYWLQGLFANFIHVFSFLLLLRMYLLKGFFLPRKYKFFISLLQGLKPARTRLPHSIYISTATRSYPIIHDLSYSSPNCLGLSDTNTDTRFFSAVIPSNDESMSLMFFFLELISRNILVEKFFFFKTWHTRIRKNSSILLRQNKLIKVALLLPTEQYFWSEKMNSLLYAAYRSSTQLYGFEGPPTGAPLKIFSNTKPTTSSFLFI